MGRILLAIFLLTAGAAGAATLPPVVRGSNTIYLQAPAGPLDLKLYKRDLNIYAGPDVLEATLYDRDGAELLRLSIPDDGMVEGGKAGTELQSAAGQVALPAAGVYRLKVQNPGGSDLVYGLQTSAPKCVLRGDVMLNDGAIEGRLVFMPPAEKFKLTAQALHQPGQQQMALRDGAGTVLHTFDLSRQGVDQVLEVAPERGARTGLWQLDVAHMDLKVLFSKPVYWTLDTGAYFDADRTRWLLLPYRQTRYLPPGGRAVLSFELRNSFGPETAFALQVQPPDGLKCRLLEPASPATLAPKGLTPVRLEVRADPGLAPGKAARGSLTVTATTDPTVGQSVSFEILSGPSPVDRPLALPIVLQRYEHENVQFGYAPEYAPNEVYFDAANNPVMRERTASTYSSAGVQVLEDGQWVLRGFLDLIKQSYPRYIGSYGGGGFLGAKVAFDGQGGWYTLLRVSQKEAPGQGVVLYSPDRGQTWDLQPLPGSAFDVEQFVGHNALTIPPPVLAYVFTKSHPADFAGYHDLLLFMPQVQSGKLALGDPIKVAENCVGSCQHSGGPASTATRDGKTHVVWGEIAPDDAPGVPTYVATYDHATGQVGPKVLLGHGPPVNDVHNVPAICQDSRGYIHVLLGAHGQPFQYTRSLQPHDAYSGWTQPVPVLTRDWVDAKNPAPGKGGQTYISLVCGADDTLHIAYRQWRAGVDPYHGGQLFAALSVQSKPRDGDWSPARPLVIPACAGYSIYYHKLTVDRRGRLYLSYSYYTSDLTYQDDFPDLYNHRALLTSGDGGETWKLATTADFQAGITGR